MSARQECDPARSATCEPDWEYLRRSLAIAILGFASPGWRGGLTVAAAERLLDALSAPDGPLPELRLIGSKPSPHTISSPVPRAFDEAEIARVCLSFRHDFGLLHPMERAVLKSQARNWERAFNAEHEAIAMGSSGAG